VQQGKRTAPAGSRQITKEKTMTERFEMIERAYSDALGGRDPEHVNIVELLPAIKAAVPDTNNKEIVAALRWAGERAMREGDELEREMHARFGDGIVPFRPRRA
jgi:hypothetical protein